MRFLCAMGLAISLWVTVYLVFTGSSLMSLVAVATSIIMFLKGMTYEVKANRHSKVRKGAGDLPILQKWDTLLQDDRWRHISYSDFRSGKCHAQLERERNLPNALHEEIQSRDGAWVR